MPPKPCPRRPSAHSRTPFPRAFLLVSALAWTGCGPGGTGSGRTGTNGAEGVPGWTDIALVQGRTEGGVAWWASGSGIPLVLLHAFSLDSRMWDPILPGLGSSRFRVLRVDARGHGESAPPEGEYASYRDVLAAMDEAGMSEAWIVGLSSGSQVAADLALAEPERVLGLVLASPSVSGYRPVGGFEWMLPVGEAARAGGPEGAAAAWADTPIMRIEGNQDAAERVRTLTAENAALWGLSSNLDRPPEPAAFLRMGEIRQPTLVLAGERDLVDTRRVAGLLGYCLPRVQVEVLPERGHLHPLEDPLGFATRVASFVTESGSALPDQGTPPGCRRGEDVLGPGSLGPFARFVGGTWTLGESQQVMEWGVGRRSVNARLYFADEEGGRKLVSEFLWYWDPGEEGYRGVGVAVDMGVDLFKYRSEFQGDDMVNSFQAFGPGQDGTPQLERLEFQGADRYDWVLLDADGSAAMSGSFRRVW